MSPGQHSEVPVGKTPRQPPPCPKVTLKQKTLTEECETWWHQALTGDKALKQKTNALSRGQWECSPELHSQLFTLSLSAPASPRTVNSTLGLCLSGPLRARPPLAYFLSLWTLGVLPGWWGKELAQPSS